jgi:hypothetical protein
LHGFTPEEKTKKKFIFVLVVWGGDNAIDVYLG